MMRFNWKLNGCLCGVLCTTGSRKPALRSLNAADKFYPPRWMHAVPSIILHIMLLCCPFFPTPAQ